MAVVTTLKQLLGESGEGDDEFEQWLQAQDESSPSLAGLGWDLDDTIHDDQDETYDYLFELLVDVNDNVKVVKRKL